MSEKLKGLLKMKDTPVVGPKTAEELRNWLTAQPTPTKATIDDIDEHITALSLATKERAGTTKLEAKARLDLYARALRDIAKPDLARGVDDLIKTMTFMPAPAEVRAAALKYAGKREFALFRAREILRAHARYEPPLRDEDRATPEDIAAVKKMMAERFPSAREASCEEVGAGGSEQ